MQKSIGKFVWDAEREVGNIRKHGVDFLMAVRAFSDPNRKIYTDSKHSEIEERFFCIGKVKGKVLTVRFVYREGKIRIFGAAYWRKGRQYYEEENG